MQKRFLGSMAAWLILAGVAVAQPVLPAPERPPANDHVVLVPEDQPEGLAAAPAGGAFADDDINMPEQIWFRGEYLRWKVKDGPMSFLRVTTGSPTDFEPGALGQPGTRLLFDASSLHFEDQSGGRLSAGYWLDVQKVFVEASAFLLEKTVNSFSANSQANRLAVVALPFVEQPGGQFISFQAAVAGQFAGGVSVSNTSQLGGLEANLINVCETGASRWMVVLGVRYLDLQEHLNIDFLQQAIGLKFVAFGVDASGAVEHFPAPNAVSAADSFSTRNQFTGGQLGGRWEHHLGKFWVNAGGQLAIGQNHEVVDRGGVSQLIGPAGPRPPIPGGLFAVASNSGRIISDNFALVPEMHVRGGYTFLDHWTAFVGYDVLYWNRVVRPGDQVDVRIGTVQVPTFSSTFFGEFDPRKRSAFPTRLFNQADFWAQGVSVGLECRY